MATIEAMPGRDIIDGFKGTLDYYLCRGVPCVRKWPHWRKRTPTPEERANQDDFKHCTQLWSQLPDNVRAAWNAQAAGTPLTGRDIYTRAYMKGLDY